MKTQTNKGKGPMPGAPVQATLEEKRSLPLLRHRGPLVVEIVGLAGAGKTALARALAAADPGVRTGFSVYTVPRPALGLAALQMLPAFVRLYRGVVSLARDDFRQMVRLNTLYRVLRRAIPECRRAAILDEGPVFALATFEVFGHAGLRTAGFERWRQAAVDTWAQTLHGVVWLDASDDILLQRIRSREQRHHMKQESDAAITDFLACYRRAYRQVLGEIAARRPQMVQEFDTAQQSPEQIARQVLDRLERESA